MNRNKSKRSVPSMLIVSFAGLAVAGLMLLHPAEVLESAVKGVAIWWDVLFPSLLPFFVISELMLGFGIVHFLGALMDPLMRPLFRIPGIGGFVMAMGFASGYPIGAKLTSRLWEEQLLTREEGERLVAFTTSADPIFLIGAVSVGFFHDGSLAVVFALTHYGAAMLLGLLMRFHGRSAQPAADMQQAAQPAHAGRRQPLLLHALRTMHEARLKDGRPFGTMLRQAVESALRLIAVVGGLVVFFSVLLEVFSAAHLMDVLYMLCNNGLHLLGIPRQLTEAVVNGLFEVTLGVKSAGGAGGAIPLIHKVAVAGFVLSWGGLSVHAQILSLLHQTNLRYRPFLQARLIHGLLTSLLVYLFWTPLMPLRAWAEHALPALGQSWQTPDAYAAQVQWFGLTFAVILPLMLALSLLFRLAGNLLRIWQSGSNRY